MEEYDPNITPFNYLVKMLRFWNEKQCLNILGFESRTAFRKQIYGRYNRLRNKRERLDLLTTCLKVSKPLKPRALPKKQAIEAILETADLDTCKAYLAEELTTYKRAAIVEKIHVRLCKVRSNLERNNNYRVIP